MQTQFLILGQGLCGTWLSYYLKQAGASCIVIDNAAPHSASRIASGVINPVTGRRMVKTWMADTLLPFAEEQYDAIAHMLGEQLCYRTVVYNFFPSLQMKESHISKELLNENEYVGPFDEANEWKQFFNFDYGAGLIGPTFYIKLKSLLQSWSGLLKSSDALLEETFNWDELVLQNDGIRYKDIQAEYLIVCDGVAMESNRYFSKLPMVPNKGEAVLVSIPDLPSGLIYKKGQTLVPWEDQNIFWLGSNYLLNYENNTPSKEFYQQSQAYLKDFLKVPFEIIDHISALRPTNLERRPFVGMHPLHPRLGILNGMGTKGCSLAPYFAHQLTNHLLHGSPILPEASIDRFGKEISLF